MKKRECLCAFCFYPYLPLLLSLPKGGTPGTQDRPTHKALREKSKSKCSMTCPTVAAGQAV